MPKPTATQSGLGDNTCKPSHEFYLQKKRHYEQLRRKNGKLTFTEEAEWVKIQKAENVRKGEQKELDKRHGFTGLGGNTKSAATTRKRTIASSSSSEHMSTPDAKRWKPDLKAQALTSVLRSNNLLIPAFPRSPSPSPSYLPTKETPSTTNSSSLRTLYNTEHTLRLQSEKERQIMKGTLENVRYLLKREKEANAKMREDFRSLFGVMRGWVESVLEEGSTGRGEVVGVLEELFRGCFEGGEG